ncbi:hypothetical protein IFO70_12045 [Phormidium tenue FACHB-886]|nr:hypothetical protein [Phormidium tenue FACHB-886]
MLEPSLTIDPFLSTHFLSNSLPRGHSPLSAVSAAKDGKIKTDTTRAKSALD